MSSFEHNAPLCFYALAEHTTLFKPHQTLKACVLELEKFCFKRLSSWRVSWC